MGKKKQETSKDLILEIGSKHSQYDKLKEDIAFINAKSTHEGKKEIPELDERATRYEPSDDIAYEADVSFINELEYYYTAILNIEFSDHIEEDIARAMPKKNNPNFDKLIRMLKLRLIKEIKETSETMEELKNGLDDDDKASLIEEVCGYHVKERYLDSISKDDAKLEEVLNAKNRLFYVTTLSGVPKVLSDIDDIDQELHYQFKELLKSIVDGEFKGVKKFTTTNKKLAGLSEVKWQQGRIIFDRIGPGDYAIVYAFKKNVTNTNGYAKKLAIRIEAYKKQKEDMKKALKNEEYITQHEKITDQIFDILGKNKNNSGGKKC